MLNGIRFNNFAAKMGYFRDRLKAVCKGHLEGRNACGFKGFWLQECGLRGIVRITVHWVAGADAALLTAIPLWNTTAKRRGVEFAQEEKV